MKRPYRWEPLHGNPFSSIWSLIEGPIDAVRAAVVDASHHGEGWRFTTYGPGKHTECGFATCEDARAACMRWIEDAEKEQRA